MSAIGSVLKKSATYKAAVVLMNEGPMKREMLFSRVHFGEKRDSRNKSLRHSVQLGWLEVTHEGLIACSDMARMKIRHDDLDDESETPKYLGEIVPARERNYMTSPPLSAKYLTNSRGFRDDSPAWSERSGVSFFTQA